MARDPASPHPQQPPPDRDEPAPDDREKLNEAELRRFERDAMRERDA